MTKIVSPHFMHVDGWRQVVQNNQDIEAILFEIQTNETWLPLVLSSAGFFVSNGEVKKNRLDLWRDVIPGEIIKLRWAEITILHGTDYTVE